MFAAAAAGAAAAALAAARLTAQEAANNRLEQNRIQNDLIRRLSDPFEILSESQFQTTFRLPKEIARTICDRISPLLPEEGPTSRIPTESQILITLNFYGTGNYQQSIANMRFFCISQPTVSRIIENVTRAIINELGDEYIKFPHNEEELQRISRRFQTEAHFPGIVGCIDCTYIRIVGPRNQPWLYKNYKKFYSINVQVTCDDQMSITSVDSHEGLIHDARIWRLSEVKEEMDLLNQEFGGPYFLLGDAGYPLSHLILTPIPNADENTPEYRFTRRHTHTRCIIERVFGMLKGRFRCLYTLRGLEYDPEKVTEFFIACAVLHNLIIEHRLGDIIEKADDSDDELEMNGVFFWGWRRIW